MWQSKHHYIIYASVQFSCSVVSDSLWPFGLLYIRLPYASPTPKLSHAHVHWGGDAIHHLILCHPCLLLPSIFPSIRILTNESGLHIRWPKYWSFSFSIGPSNEYSGLIFFRMDCLDLFAVQGTLKSLFQYHSSKASVLLTSIHDYWKNYSFNYMDLSWQSDVSAI